MFTEEDLYKGCLKGSKTMQRALFKEYLPMMHAICLRYAENEAEADDIVQEGFVRVFTKVDSFTWKGKQSFVKWMKTIFINLAINTYKKRLRNPFREFETIEKDVLDYYEEETDSDSSFKLALETFSYEDILQSILLLPNQFRIVFNLFAIEGLKHKEIANMLDIPVKTSTTRYLRAKAKLKVILESKLTETLRVPIAQ